MTFRRLLPIFLVLIQSGLAAAHAHVHPHLANHTEAPHLHLHDLLALFGSDHGDEDDHDGDDHDADAVDLSDLTVPASPPPTNDTAALALDLPPADTGPAFAETVEWPPTTHGLPPPTAGPTRPLYLVLCSLTI